MRDTSWTLAYTCKVSSSLEAWPGIMLLEMMNVFVHRVVHEVPCLDVLDLEHLKTSAETF